MFRSWKAYRKYAKTTHAEIERLKATIQRQEETIIAQRVVIDALDRFASRKHGVDL